MFSGKLNYQNVMHYSAYRGISIECDVNMRQFTICFRSGAVVETLEKKAAECCKIFGFDSPSSQFIFNGLN